ncbi:hypothetical protein OIE75_41170 (plasmid) [Streptomyces sp. NBC_01723]|uniref:hypothetical protein n=1 Tax=Streptomyces sp. NBC_01723 TaxID=2975921 RepID=UPI002E34D330|nr:hypothetical protein [Streptomyces sp. NBC_01723]
MSAAQPADPARPYVNDDVNSLGDAAVLPLNPRRTRGALRTARGRWHHMGDTQQPEHRIPPIPRSGARPDDVSALQAWAETIETSFNAIDQSLTNPQTRATFLLTLDMWERTLQGFHAQGVLTDDQLREMMIPLDGMRRAPRIIDPG